MSNRKRQAVYIIATDRGVVKVGISDNPPLRLAQLQTGAPFPLRLAYAAVHSDASRIEAMVHRHLRDRHAYGEWYSVTEAQARDAILRAAKAIGKPIVEEGIVTPRMKRRFWFMLGVAIIVLWMVFSFLFAMMSKAYAGFEIFPPEAPPAGASYCVEIDPETCPYPWTFWQGRWVYSPWKIELAPHP
jgi:hypothetical protein